MNHRPLLVAPLAALLTGCGFDLDRATHFSIVSRTISATTPGVVPVGDPVTVRACSWAAFPLVAVFGGGDHSSESELTRRALAQADADLLLDADIKATVWSIGVFTRGCTIVTGQPATYRRSIP